MGHRRLARTTIAILVVVVIPPGNEATLGMDSTGDHRGHNDRSNEEIFRLCDLCDLLLILFFSARGISKRSFCPLDRLRGA